MEAKGPHEQVRVVLVPGIGNGAGMWRSTNEFLLFHGVDATAIDLPGFGMDRSLVWLRSYDRAIQALRSAVSQAAGPEPVVVVGHSLGGIALMEIANSHPSIAGLVLVNANLEELVRSLALQRMRDPRMLWSAFTLLLGSSLPYGTGMVDVLLAHPLSKRLLLGDLILSPDDVPTRRITDAIGGAGSVNAWSVFHHAGQVSVHDLIHSLDLPFFVIGSEGDRLETVADRIWLSDLDVPSCRGVARIEDCGHWSPVERPEEVAAAILEACTVLSRARG